MPRRTQGVLDLVTEVIPTMPTPYGEDIIEDVFYAIEHHPEWRRRYDELGVSLHPTVVNNAIGRYTKGIVGMETIREVAARRSDITTAYSKLRLADRQDD